MLYFNKNNGGREKNAKIQRFFGKNGGFSAFRKGVPFLQKRDPEKKREGENG